MKAVAELNAIESWRGKVVSDPADARARLGLATALQKSGRLNSALIEYEAVLKLYPTDIAALYGRGALLMTLNRPKDAEAALWAVLAVDKSHVRASEDLGEYYAAREQYRSLLEAVRPAATAHPTEPRLQFLMGLAFENLGQRAKALARYRAALAASPDLPEALEGLERLESTP